MMRTVRSHAVRCCSTRCSATCSMVSCSACLTTSSTAPVVCVRMRIAPADPPVGLDDPPRLRNHLHLAFGARADLRRFPVEPVWVKALQQSAVPIPHLGIRRGGGNPEHLVPIHACACRPQVPRHPGLSQRQLLFTGPICEQGVLGPISSCRRRVKCRNRGDRDPPAIKQARHGPAGVSSTPFPWCQVAAPEGAVVLPDRAGGANGPLSAGTDDLPEAENGCNWRLRYTG